jgi:hypothetical protein
MEFSNNSGCCLLARFDISSASSVLFILRKFNNFISFAEKESALLSDQQCTDQFGAVILRSDQCFMPMRASISISSLLTEMLPQM